jgi:RNA polymerase sigma factor (sigma-70 family)
LDEQAWIASLKQGDEQAFRRLTDDYGGKVYNLALSIVQKEDDAEDLTQETFVQVFKSIGHFKGDSKLGTWIYRITVNKCFEFERKKKAAKRFAWFKTVEDEEPADFNHPGVVAENREKANLLFKALKQIPENQRTAFLLNKSSGLSYQEVASIMNTSVGAVESLLHRAKLSLKKILSGPD